MAKKVGDLVRQWAQQTNAVADFLTIRSQIHHLARRFDEYEPTRGAGHAQFIDRLNGWIGCVPDPLVQAQQALFQLVPHIAFFGPAEFDSLCQSAFDGQVAWWLMNLLGVTLDAPDAQSRLREAARTTWFCAITDSMPIAKFHHLNGIQGGDLRPDWRSLHELGNNNQQQIIDYMAGHDLDKIVLLEDFVGSGTQMQHAVEYAASLPNNCPILLCPLIIAPDGVGTGRALELKFGHRLTFHPVLEIPEKCFVRPIPTPNEDPLYPQVRAAVQQLEPHVKDPNDTRWYGNFGFRDTGGLVVMYTNCQDNSLPIIHYTADGSTWQPLFPRASRL